MWNRMSCFVSDTTHTPSHGCTQTPYTTNASSYTKTHPSSDSTTISVTQTTYTTSYTPSNVGTQTSYTTSYNGDTTSHCCTSTPNTSTIQYAVVPSYSCSNF